LGNHLLPIRASRQLGNRRLPNFGGRESPRVFVSELHHQLQVSLGKAFQFRQLISQLAR
jgi:hypothetical protein